MVLPSAVQETADSVLLSSSREVRVPKGIGPNFVDVLVLLTDLLLSRAATQACCCQYS